MNKMRDRVALLLAEMNRGIYEKEHVMAVALLAAVAGESIFLLGPPGVAKSLISRRLKYAFRDGRSFEYLMSRFSTPDEIFGPVSISRLKEADSFERVTKGYLPDADVVFLDELWKAGPSIQNTLLTVINERLFRNGDREMKLPLKVLVTASNELPAKGEGLEALWDRLLVRCYVGCIESVSAFDEMLLSADGDEPSIDASLQITDNEYRQWQSEIDHVAVPKGVLGMIHSIKDAIEKHNSNKLADETVSRIYVSDRRWKKIVRILRTQAFLNGRSEVALADIFVLKHLLWDEYEQYKPLLTIIKEAYAEAVGEELGVSVLTMKMEALADDMKADNSHRELTDDALQVVGTFYYQLMGVRTRDRVLVYISEYQTLRADADSFWYKYRPKNMPGTIVLRRYDRTKAYGVTARDIVKVRRGMRSVFVAGMEYPLLLVEGADRNIAEVVQPSIVGDFSEKIGNVKRQFDEVKARLDDIRKRETGIFDSNLFYDDSDRKGIERCFDTLKARMAEIENDIEERAHANKVENLDY
ncbi:MAG: AAA family ATPase [Bacteroidaceae bacterium]|nr:AAA family ATPase [Bacteroidaceae bacterium]